MTGDSTWIAFNGLDTPHPNFVSGRPLPYGFARWRTDSCAGTAVTRSDDVVRLRFCRRVFRSDSAIAFQFDRALARRGSASADQANEKRHVEQSQRDQLHARR